MSEPTILGVIEDLEYLHGESLKSAFLAGAMEWLNGVISANNNVAVWWDRRGGLSHACRLSINGEEKWADTLWACIAAYQKSGFPGKEVK